MRSLLPLAFILSALLGCSAARPPDHQTLFGGEFAGIGSIDASYGCDARHFSECDRRDMVFAFSEQNRTGGLRLVIGPQATWSAHDAQGDFTVFVTRHGDGAPVARIDRFIHSDAPDVPGEPSVADCSTSVSMPVDQADHVTLPACGSYPEIHASWSTVSKARQSLETAEDALALLLIGMTGGEVP